MKSRDPVTTHAKQQRFLRRFVSLPFDDRAAEAYGRIRAALERLGQLIGPNDLLIAAIAVAYDVILVTHNQYLCQLREPKGELRSMNTPQAGDLVENLTE